MMKTCAVYCFQRLFVLICLKKTIVRLIYYLGVIETVLNQANTIVEIGINRKKHYFCTRFCYESVIGFS